MIFFCLFKTAFYFVQIVHLDRSYRILYLARVIIIQKADIFLKDYLNENKIEIFLVILNKK